MHNYNLYFYFISLSYDVVRCERLFGEWDYGFVLRRLYYWVRATIYKSMGTNILIHIVMHIGS